MTYPEAEQFLYSLSNMPRRELMEDASACSIYLERLQYFLDILGNPEKQIPHYVHVTGTSGKGSTVQYMHEILSAAGHTVGSTISPHPTHILERWRVKHRIMKKQELVTLVAELKPALDTYIRTSPHDMISFFELTTALGLLFFAKQGVTHAVVEVGCGGRYDGTNVIPQKDIAVITNVGLDHAHIIGPTRADIAYEKAGIITKGCVAVTGVKQKALQTILTTEAEKKHVPLLGPFPKAKDIQSTQKGTSFSYKSETYTLSALGAHQIENAILAIEASEQLSIPTRDIKKGLQKAQQPCRLEVVSTAPHVILDSAHNKEKMRTTVATILELFPEHRVHLVLGFSENKDIRSMIRELKKLRIASVACTRNTVNHFRKVAPPTDIASYFSKEKNTKTALFLDSKDAYAWSLSQAKKPDLVLVTGSLFLTGELRPNA